MMKPDEQYKHSGIEWLGQVPGHWGVKKITHIFRKIGSGTTPTAGMPHYYDNGEINWLQTGDLNDGIINETSKKITPKAIKDFSSLKIYSPNSLVIAMYGATIGKVGLLNIHTTTNQACCVLSDGHNLEIKYVFYFFQAFKDKIVAMAYGGGQPNISQDLIKSLRICIPPFPEQLAIAEFLDAKTARIQTAIGIKNEQIAKLKEYRQALINQTVTKGLKVNVAMKNSGVAWLGDVPEHWEVLSLKRVARINPSVYVKDKRSDEKVCFLPMEKVLANGQIIDDLFLPIKNVSSGFTIFAKNDVIVAKITPCFENGKSAFLDKLPTEFGYGSTEFHVLRPSKKILGKFLYLIIHSKLFLDNGEAMMIGSAGQKRVPTDFVANFKIALPPLPEQLAIAEFLDEKTAQIDTAIAQYQRQIERLKEYRQSLVNEAVTGKIRIKQD